MQRQDPDDGYIAVDGARSQQFTRFDDDEDAADVAIDL